MSRTKNPFPEAPPLVAAPHDPVGCRYVFGDTGPGSVWRYCQAVRVPGKSYCPHHHALCTRAPTAEEVAEFVRRKVAA